MKTKEQLDAMTASEIAMELRTNVGKHYDQLEDELLKRLDLIKAALGNLGAACDKLRATL